MICFVIALGANANGEQQYSLRWNDFHSAMVSSFRRLRDEEDFVDVTLACAGATFSAHKVIYMYTQILQKKYLILRTNCTAFKIKIYI